MLRELIDIAVLEDFVAGLARASGLRFAVYNVRGELMTVSQTGPSLRNVPPMPATLPQRLEMIPLLPAPEPPAGIGFIERDGLRTILVPVHVDNNVAGYVAVGAFRDPGDGPAEATLEDGTSHKRPPVLPRFGNARPVVLARWASRMLADWCLSGARLSDAAEELSLLGDIGELLSGTQNLQTVLDHIVAETARVMGLQYCSLRLYDHKTDELTVKAGYNIREQEGDELTIRRSENPIDDAALRGEIVYVEDATRDSRIQFAEEARRLGIVSGLAAGMIYRKEPIGVLRVYANHRKRFRGRQRNLLRAVASQAAIAVANARLLDQRLRSAVVERQLKTAGEVQTRMMRIAPPKHPRIEPALLFEPSSDVGGDFCDIFELPDGRLAAVVGDVTGHGVPAALVMASARGALRASARHCTSLADLVAQLNDHVWRETTSSEFVTLLLVAVDPAASQLHYVNAGNEPLLLLRSGEIVQTDQADLVLGVDPSQRYNEHTLDLKRDDFVLLYTDGVVEAMDFEGRVFGRDRLLTALGLYGTMPPDQALGNIRWDVRRFVGLAEQSDDLTMVGLRVAGRESMP